MPDIKQNWKKLGRIIKPTDFDGIDNDFCAVPVAIPLSENEIRIIYSSRNERNCSTPYYVDFDILNLKIIGLPTKIDLPLGDLGCFDDSGIMPTSVVQEKDHLAMYYIGWNLGVTVPFRNSVGHAKSYDQGKSFVKSFEGPILDRTKEEPHFVASNHVLKEGELYKIWYLSCVKWEKTEPQPKHRYHIKYAESTDGIHWKRNGQVAIEFVSDKEYAISVPRVLKENGIYKMWYSYRAGKKAETYRIGYAESKDGMNWERKDELVNLDVSESDWDSDMICYPFVFDHNHKRYMLYNGNAYGKTGLGLAYINLSD